MQSLVEQSLVLGPWSLAFGWGWTGTGDAMDEQDKGVWNNFEKGMVTDGKGGTVTIKLS